jgi:tetratricopeptide (TPR) repeat protein
MFDEITAAARRAGNGGVATRYDKTTEGMSSVLNDGEIVQHVLATTKEITYTDNNRKITIDAGSGHHVASVVTNQRMLVFVGGQEETPEPDVAWHMSDVVEAEYRDSLLSTSVYLATSDESIELPPSKGAPETYVSYVDRTTTTWETLQSALESVRDAIETFEERKAAGSDTDDAVERVRSELERARNIPTEQYDAPEDTMNEAIDRVAEEFEAARTDVRAERIEERIEKAAAADDYGTICDLLGEASEELAATRSAVDDEDVHSSLDDLEADLAELAETFVGDAATARQEAEEADPVAAVELYVEAHQRYEAASAVADAVDAFDAADASDRRQAVTVELYDALQAKADHLEASGDEGDGDDYQRAKTALERARDVADRIPTADPDELEEDIARLEEAIERSEWVWGDT